MNKMEEILNKLNQLSDENNTSLTIMDILIEVYYLDSEEKTNILNNPEIKKILGDEILKYCKNDYYRYFEQVLNYLSISELLSLYDVETLKMYFSNDNKYHEYKLFATCMNKDANETIKYVLQNDEMFKEFFRISDYFYSTFYNLDYDLFKQVIFKLEELNVPYVSDFLGSINEENQEQILKEDISDNTTLLMLSCFRKEIIDDFLLNNPKAIYLFEKMNIKRFVLDGNKFNINIIRQPDFFEMLKGESFVELRTIINAFEKNNDIDIIEKRLNNYYDELINYYDSNTEMFKLYAELLNNPEYYYTNHIENTFVFSSDVHSYFVFHIDYDEYGNRIVTPKEEVGETFKKFTSLKLSEIITDALFQDNLYNVRLNLKEMLRYNSKLENSSIEKEWLEFYQLILNFDNVPNDKKIEIFNKYRYSNINTKFYDDLRKLKDISYEIIRSSLFNPDNYVPTQENGIKIYDMRDKEYTMLIRAQCSFRETGSTRRHCYSIISDKNSATFDNNRFHYGYNTFELDRVSHVLEQDSFSYDAKEESPSRYVNRLMTPSEIVQSNHCYSEFDIVNVKNDDGHYDYLKPDYLVVYNEIKEEELYEAKRLNIPIVLITLKRLDKEDYLDITFDSDQDIYIKTEFDEKILRESR